MPLFPSTKGRWLFPASRTAFVFPTSKVINLLETVYLFTYSDYKTIFFPVTTFALVAAPAHTIRRLMCTEIWIWLHLIQANVSNQTFSAHEDVVNKPWRPIPSGRITVKQARTLRWTMTLICLSISSFFGLKTICASAALTLVEVVHDDFNLSGHPVYKNLMNAGGYLTFELGATLVLSTSTFDATTYCALLCSILVIFTTIHAQDFADVYGDCKSGRLTIPILVPEGSRIMILGAPILWSMLLTVLWGLGPLCGILFTLTGVHVGMRYFYLRTVSDDELSYVYYNVWLVAAGSVLVSHEGSKRHIRMRLDGGNGMAVECSFVDGIVRHELGMVHPKQYSREP